MLWYITISIYCPSPHFNVFVKVSSNKQTCETKFLQWFQNDEKRLTRLHVCSPTAVNMLLTRLHVNHSGFTHLLNVLLINSNQSLFMYPFIIRSLFPHSSHYCVFIEYSFDIVLILHMLLYDHHCLINWLLTVCPCSCCVLIFIVLSWQRHGHSSLVV